MSSSTAAAGAVGGKAARACDSCLRRRARWYCGADDAFLCQACDASVHSANLLARRHERLRLRPTASSPPHVTASTSKSKRSRQAGPGWSKRKARTRRPRHKSVGELLSRKLVVVAPDQVPSDESSEERKADNAEEHSLLYHCVPTFDRALAELCSPPPVDDRESVVGAVENVSKDTVVATTSPVQELPDGGLVAGFGPTDAELREFAADMEALLGQGMDDVSNDLVGGSFCMESLVGPMPPPTTEDGGERVKMKSDSAVSNNSAMKSRAAEMKSEAASAEVLDIDFNCCSPTAVEDDEEGEDSFDRKATTTTTSNGDAAAAAQFLRRSLDLRLNYEAVIESWGSSPWTDGQRPQQLRLDDFWPHHAAYHSGLWPAGGGRPPGGGGPLPRLRCGTDAGAREARVSRYREKRRTRLFAKKIRYEVRKLNAEKRPRMKGRFVKRPAAAGAAGGGAGSIAAAPCAVVTQQPKKKVGSQRAGACPPVSQQVIMQSRITGSA